ncbi:MAG TPA: IS30 family transposase [bacterium]|nr:IS30 family transposase [bacterium]
MDKVTDNNSEVYKHFSESERDNLAVMLAEGKKQVDIAKKMGRHPSTISREIKRNGSPINKTQYRANRAQMRADKRKTESHSKTRLKNPKVRSYVIKKLKEGLTPEQIAGRLKIDHPGLKTNYESIYLFIYKDRPDLVEYLVRGRRKRQKRGIKSGKRMVKLPNRTMIDKRPAEINEKTEYGHWEADTVVSRQSKYALAVVRERRLQVMFIRRIDSKTANNMRQAVIDMLKDIPAEYRKSITFDNGLENAQHEEIAKQLSVQTYFCHPYHSWEKGGVENGIGVIRRFLPKKTDFALISWQQIRSIENRLNNRPRKTLNYLSPLEVFKIALSH